METSSVIAVIGGIALLTGLFGGGVHIKGLIIPSIPKGLRILSSLTGVVLIGIAILLSYKPSPVPPISSVPPSSTDTKTPATQTKNIPLADMECIEKERGATVDGQAIPVAVWQKDCAYAQPQKLYGKGVTLTTWGIIIQYAGNTIIGAKIVPPKVAFIVPNHTSLFAGYQSREGAEAAYKTANPKAPEPELIH